MHLSVGVIASIFIFLMASTGVVLAFERQMTAFADRDIRSVSEAFDTQPRPLNDLLQAVRRAGLGDATGIVLRNQPQAATEFVMERGKTVYVDPYSGAVLGVSSAALRDFFGVVERLHRGLGAPLGHKNAGHWLAAITNVLFGVLVLLGVVLWLPRQWSWKAVRAAVAFRAGLRGKAREWNWHNVVGIWCALPLLVIVLTGAVMSFDALNTLLFRLTGSPQPIGGRRGHARVLPAGQEPNYDRMFTAAGSLALDWRSITLEIARGAREPVKAVIDTGTGGQPQNRTQYWLDRDTGIVLKRTAFGDGSAGQRLRAFVRFGHTGEYGGLMGQVVAALASFGGCVLVYTGFSLAIRRLLACVKRRRAADSERRVYAAQSLGGC